MARPPKKKKRKQKRKGNSGVSGIAWMGALTVLLGGIAVAILALRDSQSVNAIDKETGCLTARNAPGAALFMIDTTDKLTPEHANRVMTGLKDLTGNLPRYSRIIVVPFADDTVAPLEPIFSKCLPGRGEDARVDESSKLVQLAYEEFEDTVTTLGDRLQSQPDAPKSPITEQVVRAASDPTLHWKGDERTLVLFTDGLESNIDWTRELQLEAPPEGILDGIKVEYFEIGNADYSNRQTPQLREQWQAWFQAAGASVRMTAPGYATD